VRRGIALAETSGVCPFGFRMNSSWGNTVDEQSAGATESPTTSRAVVNVIRALRGWVVIIAGGIFLLSSYLGVSGQTDPGLQLPYLVSGGFVGLALVIIGSALLVADRLESTRGRAVAADQSRLAAQVDDLHALLLTVASSAQPAAPATYAETPAQAAPVAPPVDDGSVYAVAAGRTFHRPGCELLAGKPAQRVEASQVSGRGLSPCSVCAPILVA
jgi:hypothetical protein